MTTHQDTKLDITIKKYELRIWLEETHKEEIINKIYKNIWNELRNSFDNPVRYAIYFQNRPKGEEDENE